MPSSVQSEKGVDDADDRPEVDDPGQPQLDGVKRLAGDFHGAERVECSHRTAMKAGGK